MGHESRSAAASSSFLQATCLSVCVLHTITAPLWIVNHCERGKIRLSAAAVSRSSLPGMGM